MSFLKQIQEKGEKTNTNSSELQEKEKKRVSQAAVYVLCILESYNHYTCIRSSFKLDIKLI